MPQKRFKALRKFNRAILNPITRSLMAGRFSFCSLVYHIGRRSGKEYTTPVMAVIKDGHIYIPLTYGPDTDWYLNVHAAGLCRVKIKGRVYSASNPDLVDATQAAAVLCAVGGARGGSTASSGSEHRCDTSRRYLFLTSGRKIA